MPAMPAPADEFPCPNCDVFGFPTLEGLKSHLAARDCAKILAPLGLVPVDDPPASLPPMTFGDYERMPNGFGGTTTRRRPAAATRPASPTATSRSKPASAPTAKQTDFLRKLLSERAGIAAAESIRSALNASREAGTLTKREVSEAIETLLATPRPRAGRGR